MNETNIQATPLGWMVNLLFYFAHAATILAEDIDQQLKNMYKSKVGFIREKKKCINNYNACIAAAREKLRQADEWMQKVDIDTATFNAVNGNIGKYDNALAYANEFIRFNMLYLDRSQTDGMAEKIFKFIRSQESSGAFPENFMERFRIKFNIVPEVGDKVHSDIHGDGTLQFNTCGDNWAVELEDGSQIILNEKQFKLL